MNEMRNLNPFNEVTNGVVVVKGSFASTYPHDRNVYNFQARSLYFPDVIGWGETADEAVQNVKMHLRKFHGEGVET